MNNNEMTSVLSALRSQKGTSLAMQLQEFPSEILECDWLEELILSSYYDYEHGIFCHLAIGSCKLSGLPSDLHKLRKLKKIALSGPPFVDEKPDIEDFSPLFDLEQLEYLYVDNTGINQLSGIEKLRRLRHLGLADSLVSDFQPLQQLTELESLTLSDNRLADISFLSGFVKLKALNLASNQIKNIEVLASLSGLRRLCLCNNPISDLSVLKNTPHLRYLCCRNLRLTRLDFLAHLPDLEECHLAEALTFDDIKNNLKLKNLRLKNVTDANIKEIENYPNCEELHLSGDFTALTLSRRLLRLKSLTIDSPSLSRMMLEDFENNTITRLCILNAKIESIEPIRWMPRLESLEFENTLNLTDLTPVADLKTLKALRLASTQAFDLSPLLHLMADESFELSLYDNPVPGVLLEYFYEEGNQGIIKYYAQQSD